MIPPFQYTNNTGAVKHVKIAHHLFQFSYPPGGTVQSLTKSTINSYIQNILSITS